MNRILIIEDNQDISKILSKRLRDKGFAVDIADSGYEVLGKFRKPEKPDIVILDILLPELSGVEILNAIISTWSEAKIFIFTAYPEYREKFPFDDCIDGFFSKLEMEQLIRAVCCKSD